MKYISDKLTDYILAKGIIVAEDYALYHYGIQTGMEMLLCVIASIIISNILGVIVQSLIVAVVLFSLRAYICGIHMKKYISCFLISTAIITVGPYFVTFITLDKRIVVMACIAVVMLMHKLAYKTIEYHSDNDEIIFFTKQRKRIIAVILVAVVILGITNQSQYLNQVLYALAVATMSVFFELIRISNVTGRGKTNEKDY